MIRFVAIALGLLALFAAGFAGAVHAQDEPVEAPDRGLQTELEPRTAEDDWRTEVGLDTTQGSEPIQMPDFLAWILANFLLVLVYLIPVLILVLIIAVLVRQGEGGGFRTGAEASSRHRVSGGHGLEDPILDAQRLSLDEILRLEDMEAALGALLRLVLEAAINLTGSVLKRSSTAREILRRLPTDFAHLAAVATLVREAERVRYGGGVITRERFEELVGLVGPLLGREAPQ